MSRSIENVSKTKKLTSGGSKNSRHNRKFSNKSTDSSSISSNRNSSLHSDDDVRVEKNGSCEEQEQITKKLQAQVKELRHKLRILEDSIDSKDYSLGTISREKDRAIGEIRRLERCNKLLRQQLHDERNHYWEEKEKFCEEMTKYKRKLQDVKSETEGRKSGRQPLINETLVRQLSKQRGDFSEEKSLREVKKSKSHNLELKNRKSNPLTNYSLTDLQRKQSSLEILPFLGGNDALLQVAALRTENARLRSIICERDEQNYELCLRFLRMKHSKNDVKDRFQDLENEYLQVIANLMDKIDEARQEFNFIIDQKFKRPLHSTNAMYLQMVQKNSRIAFENAALRLENQCLKKELNKYVNASQSDSTTKRKIDEEIETKSSEKMKSIKKNVNFNEVRTIYERYQTYRISDSDSNYMSKTPTTGPSNGSLRGPKSTESIPEEIIEEDKTPQENSFSNEVLKKIFQRIDPSNQSISTTRTKDSAPQGSEVIEKTIPEKSLKERERNSMKKETKKGKKENYFWLGRNPRKEEEPLLNPRIRHGWKFEESKEGNLGFPLRKFTLSGRNRKRVEEVEKPRPSPPVDPFDCCGLEEKFEFSDLELPGDGNQTKMETGNRKKEKQEKATVRVELAESEEDEQKMKNLPPAVGSRSRSSNKLNLQEELMEANRRPTTPQVSLWRIESKVRTTQSRISTKTLRNKESKSKNLQCDLSSGQETARSGKGAESPQQKRTETSKRFSHRLFTTSPEELKNILTDPQLGSIQMTPAIVGHATTEFTPVLRHDEYNQVFMQLLLPPASSQHSAVFSQKSTHLLTVPSFPSSKKTGETVEKEPSFGEINPGCPTKSTMEGFASDVQIPLPGLPTSNSTMEILDTSTFERGNMMRTLSAPGLLESSWLDPRTICEMRDCGTNT